MTKSKRREAEVYKNQEKVIKVLSKRGKLNGYESELYKSKLWAERMVNEGRAIWINKDTIYIERTRDEVRGLVIKRDSKICRYCGNEGNEVDHIIPFSEGGLFTPKNLVCSCRKCNELKGNVYFKRNTIEESFEATKRYLNRIRY